MSIPKFFNTAGPCQSENHYLIDPAERLDHVRELIDQQKYFILHAPRQVGKTTTMFHLMHELNREDKYIALYINIEGGQAYRSEVAAVNEIVLSQIRTISRIYLPETLWPSHSCYEGISAEGGVYEFLTRWCMELPKPLILFVDEIDSLIGNSLISILRQIRAGYTHRPHAFPHSLCLIGLRDIRDYRIFSEADQRYVIGGSAFNIKDKSLRMNSFTEDQMRCLYAQHTEATGQKFTESALQKIFWYTQGQPWLVNAFGRELCFEEHRVPERKTIEESDVIRIAEVLILRRDVHLDQLADKLTEPRVERVIQKILVGEEDQEERSTNPEDTLYLIDLGLICWKDGRLEIANPLYQEVIPRELTIMSEYDISQNSAWYVQEDGRLNIDLFLDRYIEYYKEHSEWITKRPHYPEAAHHLLFMTWLHRVVNSGGRVMREYAAGMGRIDLLAEFAGERFAFELKLSGKKALSQGRKQLASYLKRLSLEFGTLVIFERIPPENMDSVGRRERIQEDGKEIEVIWM